MEAPTTSSSSPSIQTNSCRSRFQTTLCLEDWWLVKAEIDDLQGIRIAIAGRRRSVVNGVTGKQAMRVFSYLPILKRYDMFTLETTDGKCVLIEGLINKDRSAENGFPSDVHNHFTYGFPLYWKEYAEKFMLIESGGKGVSSVIEKQSPLADEQPHVGSCDNNIELQGPMNANGVEMGEKTLPTEEILSHTDSNRRNYSTRSSKLRQNKTSANSGNENIKSNSLTSSMGSDKVELACVDIEPGAGIHEFQIEVGGQKRCENEKSLIEGVPSIIEKLSPLASEQPHVGSCDNNIELQDPMDANGVEMGEKSLPTEDILSHNDTSRSNYSLRSLKTRLNKTSAKSGNEKIKSNSITSSMGFDKVELACVDIEPGGGIHEIQIEVGEQKQCENEKSLIEGVSSIIEKLSPMAGEQPHVGSCDNNVGLQDPMNVNSVEIGEIFLPREEILSHTDSNRSNYSLRSLKLRLNKSSAKSGNEKMKSKTVTSSTRPDKVELARVDIEPGGGINKKRLTKLDSGYVKYKFEQIAKAPNLKENPKAVKTHGIKRKEMQKGTSSLNEKQTVVAGSSSESAKASNKKSRKKLAYETPAKEKDKVPTDSPQYGSLNRSRSGRLLMPPLEFWRNQRKIQKADGTVIGIEEEIREGQPKMGENSRSPFVRYRKI